MAPTPKNSPLGTKAQFWQKLPFASLLVFCACLGFSLTLLRDGWPENAAWFAIALCAGGLYALFFMPQSD